MADARDFSDRIAAAVTAIQRGELVIYPTETVYGLGADALTPEAVARVFDAKERPRDRPLSIAVPDIETATTYVRARDRDRAFMAAFLPGPVTVVMRREPSIPDIVTAGRDRLGIRIPDHPVALSLLEAISPITATSANVSGGESVVHPDDLDPTLRAAVSVILDDGRTPGTESTVVDPSRGIIHRRGAMVNEIEAWLDEH